MAIIGGINLGNLVNYLFFFANGSSDANWQGATKGYVGDVAVNGIQASERTSGSVPYAGTIYTNDTTLSAWQSIVNQNDPTQVDPAQAFASYNEVARITNLQTDLTSAFTQINALIANPGDLPAPYNVNFDGSIQSLNGLNTQNGIAEVFVINITSGFSVSSQVNIIGDPGDVFIFRWDTDADFSNGYQGQVKFQSGGAIVPGGGLEPSNFIHVAGDIDASGGGSTPPSPYPQGPRFDDGTGALIVNGSDFSGGGFFTGYWLTTGSPTNGETQSLSNGIFVGGWYTTTTKFSMTSGTSGVYVSPNEATLASPSIDVEKYVSADNGTTWIDADSPTGPIIPSTVSPQFRFVVTNTGNVTLTNVDVTDSDFGTIGTLASLAPGASFEWIITETWTLGQHENTATATGEYNGITVTDTDLAHYLGEDDATPQIDIEKYVSPDNGVTWIDADSPTGPIITAGTDPQFKFVVTNTGNVTLTNVFVTDSDFGSIGTLPSLTSGASFEWIITVPWTGGQHENTATATGEYNGTIVTDTDPAHYFGADPSINIVKYVSVNEGATWLNANTPPGPLLPNGITPQFKFVITNTGNVTITDISVDDSVLGPIGTLPSLDPGQSFEWIVSA